MQFPGLRPARPSPPDLQHPTVPEAQNAVPQSPSREGRGILPVTTTTEQDRLGVDSTYWIYWLGISRDAIVMGPVLQGFRGAFEDGRTTGIAKTIRTVDGTRALHRAPSFDFQPRPAPNGRKGGSLGRVRWARRSHHYPAALGPHGPWACVISAAVHWPGGKQAASWLFIWSGLPDRARPTSHNRRVHQGGMRSLCCTVRDGSVR